MRGLDGPGLFALDVLPQSWAHLPGYEEALARRAAQLEALKVQVRVGDPRWPARGRAAGSTAQSA